MVISIGHMHFDIIENYRDAFDQEQFALKYSEVLNKYDYIVGDIGYEKLRMSGFYRDNKAKVEREKKFSAIEDYISEYCNFGCAYFILRKLSKEEVKELKEEGTVFIELEMGGPAETADDKVSDDGAGLGESAGSGDEASSSDEPGEKDIKPAGKPKRGSRGQGEDQKAGSRSQGKPDNRRSRRRKSRAKQDGGGGAGGNKPAARGKQGQKQSAADNTAKKKSTNRTLSSFQRD